MPMIDVYAAADTFPDTHTLAADLAHTVLEIEQVPRPNRRSRAAS
jgi:hypothetical protein